MFPASLVLSPSPKGRTIWIFQWFPWKFLVCTKNQTYLNLNNTWFMRLCQCFFSFPKIDRLFSRSEAFVKNPSQFTFTKKRNLWDLLGFLELFRMRYICIRIFTYHFFPIIIEKFIQSEQKSNLFFCHFHSEKTKFIMNKNFLNKKIFIQY